MKKFGIVLALLLFATFSFSQENKEKKYQKIPSVEIKTPEGKLINTSEINNNGKPIIISFWATWCKPCVNELTTISDVYEDWQKETGVLLIAVSIDDSRSSSQVKPLVDGKGWTYTVLLDVNNDFKRAMNVNLVPHTFVINGNGEIVWQHTSFSPGSELSLIDVVKKVAAGQPVTNE